MINRMCFVSGGYPYQHDNSYAFVRTLVDSIADMGIESVVIAPQPLFKNAARKRRPMKWSYSTNAGNPVNVIQPKYISTSHLAINKYNVGQLMFTKAVNRALASLEREPNIVYGHFWHAGICAAKACSGRYPIVVATGESRIWVDSLYPKPYIESAITDIKGVIAVSSKNKNESIDKGLLTNQPCLIAPNGVDLDLFKPLEKERYRKEMNYKSDDFVVAFVGSLSERKGAKRLVEACRGLDGVKLMLIGSGPDKIVESNCCRLFGNVPHDELPKYLAIADVFVLPTLAEGCCNAIIEALACGLPVISSDMDFNYDILNCSNSILVNPLDIEAIAAAIMSIKQDRELRDRLSVEAINSAKKLSITERANRIIEFADSLI